ncbi:MAG: sodium:solute symporter family protein [Planctomycetes bacterium]|nr:sodium:solute symporter family protein [Planctomycetota bacterium]
MQGLHPVDIAVIVFYLVGITALGIWMARRVKQVSDFFMPRRFGKGMMIMHAFGTGTASDQAVTVASATFRGGLSGIWYQWLWLFVTPIYWLIAPIFRRFRAITTADVYELRFDQSVAVLFALVGIANMCIKIGLMLKGASVLIESGTGGMIDTDVAIIALTVMFVTYGAAGGLAAAIVTDYVQGLLTILFSFMLLPFIFSAVGGMSGIRECVTDPTMLSLVAPGKVTAFFIIMMSIQALVGIVAQPFIMGVCAAGKTEWEGRVGIVVGNVIKRLCTAAWTLTAIGAVAWYTQQGIDVSTVNPDFVYGNVAQAFLPRIMPGLLGVFLAALLAGVMSSCDSFMISSSGLFTENIYKRCVPNRSQAHYVWIGRGVAILVVGGGVAFAFWVPSVIKALEIWFMIAPMMGLVFWIGLFWRRMTVAGAWATTLAGFAVWWLTTQPWLVRWVADFPQADYLRLIWMDKGTPTLYVPWQILAYMSIASLVGIIVSLFTPPVAGNKLDRFYELTRTPVQPGEEIARPCTLPLGVTPVSRRMITTACGLEIPMPSQASIIGFIAAWGAVAILIGGFVAFVRW